MKFCLTFVVILALFMLAVAFPTDYRKSSPQHMAVVGDTARLAINKINLGLENNGSTGLSGKSFYPNGSPITFLFSGGLATSGYVNGELRASCMLDAWRMAKYHSGKWGMSPSEARAKFYEISSADEFGSPAFNAWLEAVALGAGFQDLDGDGRYDPARDRPDILGNRTLWCVYNDSLPPAFGWPSPPLGLEIQQTVWAYDRGAVLDDLVFFRYRLINAASANIDSLIFSAYLDPDLGEYTDDLLGCDTTLSLGYMYNDGEDNQYGENAPAFGVQILQGALVDAPGESGYVYRGPLQGVAVFPNKKNLPMTSFMENLRSAPDLGIPRDSLEARIYQEGGFTKQGFQVNPVFRGAGGHAGDNPKFMYSGDPATGRGWRDNDPNDKQFLVNCGPFQLAAGDTQEVIFTYALGRGNSPTNSVAVLRRRAKFARDFFPLGKAAQIVVHDTLISTDSTVIFEAAALAFSAFDTLTTSNWQLLHRPAGSIAQLRDLTRRSARLAPDQAGTYVVAVQLAFSQGGVAADTVAVRAVHSNPPVAGLVISPAPIIFGQAALADASGSYDRNGDLLHFSWKIPAWLAPRIKDTSIVAFTPQHAGSATIALKVSGPYFSAAATQTLTVRPWANGLSVVDSAGSFPQIEQIEYCDGKIYSKDFHFTSVSIRDANDLSRRLGGGEITGKHFATDGKLLVAGGVSPLVTIYEIGAEGALTLRSTLNHELLPRTEGFADFYLQPPHLFIPARDGRLYVYDVSAAPVLIASYELPALFLRDVAFAGKIAAAFVARRNLGIITLDFSHPANITALDTLSLSTTAVRDVAFNGANIYLLLGGLSSDQIQIIDASEPAALRFAGNIIVVPVLAGSVQESIITISAINNYLLAGTKDGVKLYDVSDVQRPRERANYHAGFNVRAVAAHWPILYTGEQGREQFNRGLFALEFDSTSVGVEERSVSPPSPQTLHLLQNYPNPFNPQTTIRYQLPAPAQVEVAIYNLQGRKICMLVDRKQAPGFYEMLWEGGDEEGLPVASGIYFYRLQAGKNIQTKKMLLVR